MEIGRICFLKYEAGSEEFRERQLGVSVEQKGHNLNCIINICICLFDHETCNLFTRVLRWPNTVLAHAFADAI